MVLWLESGPRSLWRCLGLVGIGTLVLKTFIAGEVCLMTLAQSHKSRATVDYTLIGVEPQGSTQSVWPIATVANDSQSHLVASSI